jgi:CarD family transcriptional regulator, regulator of rRNA transcription
VFSLHEKVVYPGHGVAQIHRILEKNVGGQTQSFYELTFMSKDMTVLIPTTGVDAAGLRPLSTSEHIDDALKVLGQPARKISHYEFNASNWNKRNKEYQLKLRRGNLKELSEIYRDLRFISTQKELSFGEKTILQQAESLLVEEIAIVQRLAQERAVEKLRSYCSTCNSLRPTSTMGHNI